MSVDLLVHYEEDTIFHIELALWEEIRNCWKFDNLLYVDLSGTLIKRKWKLAYPDLKSVIESNPDHQYIYFLPERYAKTQQKYELLHNFEHPKDNVIYIIGSDLFGIPLPLDMRNNSKVVNILTPCNNKADHPIWAVEVATAIGYDRFLKSLRNK